MADVDSCIFWGIPRNSSKQCKKRHEISCLRHPKNRNSLWVNHTNNKTQWYLSYHIPRNWVQHLRWDCAPSKSRCWLESVPRAESALSCSTEGKDGQVLCGSQAASVRWRILLQWGWKGPTAAAEWGPAKAGGAGPDVPHTLLWLPQESCLSMERPFLSPSAPFRGFS